MGADPPRELCFVSYCVELPLSELQNFNFKISSDKILNFQGSAGKIFSGRILKFKILRKNPPGRILNLRKILKIRDLAKKPTSQQFAGKILIFLYDHEFGNLCPCLIPFQSEVRERERRSN